MFYALHARQEMEETPDVLSGMLNVFDLMDMLCLILVQIYLSLTLLWAIKFCLSLECLRAILSLHSYG